MIIFAKNQEKMVYCQERTNLFDRVAAAVSRSYSPFSYCFVFLMDDSSKQTVPQACFVMQFVATSRFVSL